MDLLTVVTIVSTVVTGFVVVIKALIALNSNLNKLNFNVETLIEKSDTQKKIIELHDKQITKLNSDVKNHDNRITKLERWTKTR